MTSPDHLELATLVAEKVVARQAPGPWLDKKQLAEHFVCSTRSIEQAMAEGMPHSMIFGRVKFKVAVCEAWMVDHGYLEPKGAERRRE